MNRGWLSSAALMASGIAGVVAPERIGAALDLPPTTSRAIAETRAGMGGTFAALGGWALLTRNPAVQRAVGVTWLGAAATRIWALRQDEPKTDATYWAFLAAEIGFGLVALAPNRRARQ
jgi:hypothetical protein